MVTDLLNPAATKLQVREDIKAGVYVDGLTQEPVGSVDDVLKVLARGAANRHTGETKMNKVGGSHDAMMWGPRLSPAYPARLQCSTPHLTGAGLLLPSAGVEPLPLRVYVCGGEPHAGGWRHHHPAQPAQPGGPGRCAGGAEAWGPWGMRGEFGAYHCSSSREERLR